MSIDDTKDISEEDDLFGDVEDVASEAVRQLSDQDLDSGDDEDRDDRAEDHREDAEPLVERALHVMDMALGRPTPPRPSDGELHSFRLPPFLGLDPIAYDSSSFIVPLADHHTDTQSPDFSANTVADTTMRFQKNTQTGQFESNTLISRWSDGSVTLHVGNNDYELQTKPLAPPKGDPKGYQDFLDSHQYLATPHVYTGMLQVVGHITDQYTVQPNKKIADAALEKLSMQLQAATRGRGKDESKDGIPVFTNTKDPELQKKEAEQAEKDRLKAQRRRETAALRAENQTNGVRSRIGGGLTLDELEGRGTRTPGSAKKKRAGPTSGVRKARRRAEYSSEEEDVPRGRNREDEYDMDDGFLAGSDEEIEEEEESEEEDIDDGIRESPKPKKQKIKRDESEVEEDIAEIDADAEEDADGEVDDAVADTARAASTGAGPTDAGRGRKRMVIEDDDEDDE